MGKKVDVRRKTEKGFLKAFIRRGMRFGFDVAVGPLPLRTYIY